MILSEAEINEKYITHLIFYKQQELPSKCYKPYLQSRVVLTPPPSSEQPGPVTEFKAQKTTKSTISLSWKKPISDGGSYITAYVLELSEGEDKWRQIHKGKEASHTISELTEGKEYTFRVKALNESGEGPPTELTVMAKDQFGKKSF